MSLTLALYWFQHRRGLKARGYSFARLCALTIDFWRRLELGSTAQARAASTSAPASAFTRHQLRARW